MKFAIALLTIACCRAETFDFHSGFWVNLHQFLYDQATDEKSPPQGSESWREAVAYYRRELVKHNLLDDDMAALSVRLARAEGASTLSNSGVAAPLAAVLEKVAPEYRKTWWPQHDADNRKWIVAARPMLAKYGDAMKKEVAAAFQTTWPAAAIRAEISVKAGWAGAYTTNNPITMITMTSTEADYQGMGTVEMLFHEASHSLDDKLNADLGKEMAARKVLFRRRFFGHAVLFYTTGEIARRTLGDYQPIGIRAGILERGWPGGLAVLEKDWKPYLDGKVSYADAIQAVVRDYSVPRN